MSEAQPDLEHDLRPTRTRKRCSSILPPAKRGRVDRADSTIESQSQEVSNAHFLQNQLLPCIFTFAGCKSEFANQNEWKHQVISQHLNLNTRTNERQLCGNTNPSGGRGNGSFNRKDLFTQHLKRLHTDQAHQGLFPCDYPECTRARDPFTRRDHYRDHLRDFHKEDIGLFGLQRKSDFSRKQWLSKRRDQTPQWWSLPLRPERGLNESQPRHHSYFDTDMPYQMGHFLVIEDDHFDVVIGKETLPQYAYLPNSSSRFATPHSKALQDSYRSLENIATALSQIHNPRHRRGPWWQAEASNIVLPRLQGSLNLFKFDQFIDSQSPKQCRERYHQRLKLLLRHERIIREGGRINNGLATILDRSQGRNDNTIKKSSKNRRRRRLLLKASTTPPEEHDARPLSPTAHLDSYTPHSLDQSNGPSSGFLGVTTPSTSMPLKLPPFQTQTVPCQLQ